MNIKNYALTPFTCIKRNKTTFNTRYRAFRDTGIVHFKTGEIEYMKSANKKIDVHHHIVPKEYLEMLKEINITKSIGVSFPDWTPKSSFSFMKKVGVEKVIASISSPGVYFKEHKEFSLKISRWCNEYMAQLNREYPDKFGAFACIPLGFVQESVEELKYALDVLKLDGVCLLTNYDGKYLGDNKYDEFFNELNKRKAVVFVHPTDPADEYNPNLQEEGLPNSLVEVTFDTTRTVANMMYRGVFQMKPKLIWNP